MGWGFLVYSYGDFSSEKRQGDINHTVNQLKKFLYHATVI